MIKRLALFLLLSAAALSAQTTTFTANLKDLLGNTPVTPESAPAYVELSLRNIGTATVPTLCRVNGVGVVTFPVNIYPVSGVASGTVYDETFITCAASTGVSYYHVRIIQGDSVRTLIKKVLFEDDFDIEGATFNLNSTAPRSAGVITPPVATAVLTNPSGNQTIVQPAGTALSINHLSAGFSQTANGADMIPANRFTDTAPTGNFLRFRNAANSADLWDVDVTGTVTAGTVPTARLSGTIPAASLPNPTASTLGGVESLACTGSHWMNTISTSGVPACTQPAFADISSSVAATQMPALTGDVTSTAGTVATTVGKVNGVTYPASPALHTTAVTTASNTEVYKVIPDCTDATGNHINYTQSTDAFSCGTSVPTTLTSENLASPNSTGTDSGTEVLTGKSLGGTGSTAPTTPFNRLKASRGTVLVSGDFAISAAATGFGSWGTTASIVNVVSNSTDAAGSINVSCSGTGQTSNPAVKLTFHDGAWPSPPVPIIMRGDGNSPAVPVAWFSVSTTSVTFALTGTCVAGNAYTLTWLMM